MTTISRICSWWRQWTLQRRIPAYREASEAERQAIARQNTRALHRARAAKTAALHRDMRGERNMGMM